MLSVTYSIISTGHHQPINRVTTKLNKNSQQKIPTDYTSFEKQSWATCSVYLGKNARSEAADDRSTRAKQRQKHEESWLEDKI